METTIRELVSTAREYVEVSVESAKLTAAEKISLLVSNLVAGALVALVFFFFLLFVSVAGALAISNWLQLPWAGWLAMGGVYLLAGIVVWMIKEQWIRIPVMNNIIQQLFKNDAGHETDQEH
ncbi:phage holin family protein [Paraflavitalea pollutisoli]|uniref:phage holin family protein n=1 Tax=Paraflavitalea pollutisoli TaxID=3034143 RepID=UPI0023ED569A|nr:phage holin family protein [Paraflavitalea sp. H1-2-19X]